MATDCIAAIKRAALGVNSAVGRRRSRPTSNSRNIRSQVENRSREKLLAAGNVVDIREEHVRFGLQPIADVAGQADRAPLRLRLSIFAWYRSVSPGKAGKWNSSLADFGQHDIPHENRAAARPANRRFDQTFEDQRIRHHRKAGKMVVQMLFGQRHRFDRRGLPARIRESIDPEPTHRTILANQRIVA